MMSELDHPIGLTVRDSTCLNAASRFCSASVDAPPSTTRPSWRSYHVEPPSSLAPESMTTSIAITPVHRARSRAHFRRREVSLVVLSPAGTSRYCRQPAAWCRRVVNLSREGFGAFPSHLVHGFDLMVGPRSQMLGPIGPTGIMVLRMRTHPSAPSGAWLLRRRTSKKKVSVHSHTEMN